jgi:uncharacterized protein involved in type VI secretion and phage assembly
MISGAEGVQASYFNAALTITIDGVRLGSDALSDLIAWDVDTTVGRPDCAVVRFHIPMDQQGTQKDIPTGWKPGATLKVEAAKVTVFEGEVTSVELTGGMEGPAEVVLNAYDKRHRLYRNETVKAFKNVTVTDIISQLVQPCGVSAGGHSGLPTTVYKHHLHQGTAGDYLDRVCHEYGLWCLAETGGKVVLKAPSSLTDVAGTVTFGIEILDYRFRQTTSGDRSTMKVRSWDPKAKQAIVGEGDRSAAVPSGVVEGPNSQTPFGAAEMRHEAWAPAQSDADKLAVGALAQSVDAGMQLDATLTFNPKVQAGKLIEVKGVSSRFVGKYRVTSAHHAYDNVEGNRTYVTCRGSDDVTVTGLLESAVATSPAPSRRRDDRIDGVNVAVITKVKSVVDEGAVGADGAAGEVKVKLPWLDDTYETGWLRVVTVGGGKDRGFFVMPEVGDEVLVAFEGGDPRRGYVLGGLYNGKDAAPRSSSQLTDGQVIQERVWRSRTGHEIVLGDEDGKEYVQIILGDKKTKIRLDKKNTKLTIESTNVTILPDGKVEIISDAEIKMKATSDFKLEAVNIEMKASANVKIEGGAQVSINGTAGAELKGAKVDINSQGPATVKGNPIMLN